MSDFFPPEYLGPARPSPVRVTPYGIRVDHQGFRRADVPECREGVRARVELPIIDALWRKARDEAGGAHSPLSIADRGKALNLPDVFVRVRIEPTIWKAGNGNIWLAGTYLPNEDRLIRAVVWYKSQATGKITNWEGVVLHEMKHAIYLHFGCGTEPESAGGAWVVEP